MTCTAADASGNTTTKTFTVTVTERARALHHGGADGDGRPDHDGDAGPDAAGPADGRRPPAAGDAPAGPGHARRRRRAEADAPCGVKRAKRGLRARFTLSERATVTIVVRRKGVKVKTLRRVVGKGRHALRIKNRKLRRGRFVVVIRATDAAGNTSRVVRRVRVRRPRAPRSPA